MVSKKKRCLSTLLKIIKLSFIIVNKFLPMNPVKMKNILTKKAQQKAPYYAFIIINKRSVYVSKS